MSNMFGKLKEIIGFGEYDDEDFEDLEEVEEEEEVEEVEPIISNKEVIKWLIFIIQHVLKVMVVKPGSYEEAREIVML